MTSAEGDLIESGFKIASSFLESPVSGGFSWLAEATFLTGLWIDRQEVYDLLLSTKAESLPRFLESLGYQTLVAMPGIVKGEWPEGISFYGFDDHLYSWDFEYAGPMFSYVAVPDQYTIWKTFERIQTTRIGPVYAEYVLVSSHAPFNRIPPVIENWELGDGSIYNSLEIEEFDNSWISGDEYDEGYVASIAYVIRSITLFLTQFLDDDQIVILVGDHQPKRPVRESDAPKLVPIHLISRQAAFPEAFSAHGFCDGIKPEPISEPLRMDEFYPLIRSVLSKLDSEPPLSR